MAISQLAGLRGALAGLIPVFFFLATGRNFVGLAIWSTGAWERAPRIVTAVYTAARFACVATAVVAVFGAAYVDDGAIMREFYVCSPSKSIRATGMTSAALLLLFLSSPRFFVASSAIIGLQLVSNGETAMGFVAANVALLDEPASTSSLFWTFAAALCYSLIIHHARARDELCGNTQSSILAATAWIAAFWHLLRASFAACRERMRARRVVMVRERVD